MTQFYQLTLKDALTQYQAGFLSSAGLLFNYLKIKFAPGWKMQINQQKVCQELGLSRDQFYRGLKLIKKHFPNLKLYRTTALVGEFETQNDTAVNKPVVPATNSVVEAANSSVDSTKPVAPTANRVVETATNAPPKPPKIKASSDSPDSSSNSYQSFSKCEPDYDKQLWQPNWYCFCCHDTGFVIERLAAYVIEGYTSGQHKIARCRGSKCQAEIGETLEASGSLDNRLTREICDYLDNLERSEWARTLKRKHELRKQALGLVDELAERKSIRLRRRTSEEEMEVRRKHEEVINQ